MNLGYIKLLPTGMARGSLLRFHKAFLTGDYPTFLLLEVTERCNCRCTMCRIWAKKNPVEPSLSDYERLFRDPLWRSLRILSLTGGEPFLRNDLKDLLILASQLIPRLERISLPSNGLLSERIEETTRGVISSLPKHISFKIGISLDGQEKIHDTLRGVPSAFSKAVETIKRLKSIKEPNFSVGILSLITPENAPYLENAHSFYTSLTDQVTYTLLTQAEFFGNLEKNNFRFSPEATEYIRRFIEKTLIPECPEKAYLYSRYCNHLVKNRRTYPCLAGYLSAYVDVKGNLLPCHYVGEDFTFANFLTCETTLEKEWFSPRARTIRRRLRRHSYCLNCSNNCDFRNLVREDFWNFFGYLVSHPGIPASALFHNKKFR